MALHALEGEKVTAEIARMLGALSDKDDTALAHARKMLVDAQK